MSNSIDEAFERLERMTIKVASPDRSVSAKYNLVQGIALEFDARALRNHDEKTLGEQVRHTIMSVNRGYNTGVETVVSQAMPDTKPDESPEAARRRARYRDAIARLDEEAVSPRGLVKVRLVGGGELTVRYKPGVLSGVGANPDSLAAETVAAVNSAIDAVDRKRRQLAREILETPTHATRRPQ